MVRNSRSSFRSGEKDLSGRIRVAYASSVERPTEDIMEKRWCEDGRRRKLLMEVLCSYPSMGQAG